MGRPFLSFLFSISFHPELMPCPRRGKVIIGFADLTPEIDDMIGKLPADVLEALLETLPLEFSVVDADDKVLAWNRHETRIFKRPPAVVGKDVHNCHPKKSVDKVERILAEMKAGKRDSASFWIDLPIGPGKSVRKVLIEYYALRDKDGKYLGCLEASQDVTGHRELEGQKRLLD